MSSNTSLIKARSSPCWFVLLISGLLVAGAPSVVAAPQSADVSQHKADAEAFFREHIGPFIKANCLKCHSNKRPTEAGVNFSPALTAPGDAAFSDLWKRAVARVKAHDMPPEDADNQPSESDREIFAQWLAKVRYLSEKDPGPFVIRRLTKREYANTLHDLFGVDRSIADQLPDEVGGSGYLNSFSPLQLEHYLTIANRVLDQLKTPSATTPTELQQILFGKIPPAEDQALSWARDVARTLARRAYRRPPSTAEVDVLIQVYELARQNDLDHLAAIGLMLKATLVSPQFLCITPVEPAVRSSLPSIASPIVPLDQYQLASRLSYLLWATLPDDQLMELADRGALHDPATLESQVRRLLNDPRSRALFDGFGAQWLGLGSIDTQVFDAAKFPSVTAELRAAMYDEVRLFFESIVRENQSVVQFIDSDYTFLNGSLATLYGLENSVVGREMRKVPLSDKNRGGLLGMPAILAATSFPDRTSPVKRGVWVLEQLLGDHVPPPPPDVPDLEQQDPGRVAKLTLRERTELHQSNPACANCHKLLDPIGFSLENFDAIGRWRSHDDNGEPIDSAGLLPDGLHFSGPQELKQIVARRTDALCRNIVEKLLAYALCRTLTGYDEIVVDELMPEIAKDGYRMQTLVIAVITSYPFTHCRIQDD